MYSYCVNGHFQGQYDSKPYDFCPKCGGKVLDTCPECGTPLTWDKHFPSTPPDFCVGCGAPLPWHRHKEEAVAPKQNDDKAKKYLTTEECVNIKKDLLDFVHSVANGELSTPEHIQNLLPTVQLLAKFFG